MELNWRLKWKKKIKVTVLCSDLHTPFLLIVRLLSAFICLLLMILPFWCLVCDIKFYSRLLFTVELCFCFPTRKPCDHKTRGHALLLCSSALSIKIVVEYIPVFTGQNDLSHWLDVKSSDVDLLHPDVKSIGAVSPSMRNRFSGGSKASLWLACAQKLRNM